MKRYRVDLQSLASVVVEAEDEEQASIEAIKKVLEPSFRAYWDVQDDGVRELEDDED